MDLRQLKRFVAIAEARSFNKAAEALAVSQPSLTRSIQLLEETLEAKLLERGPRGIYLTEMGEELLPHAKIILNERDRAISSLRHIRDQQSETITIGAEASFTARRLPLAIATAVEGPQSVKVRITEGALAEMLDRVREGSVDFALGSKAPYLDLEGLSFEKLADEGASVVMRAEHPLLAGGPPSLEDLVHARWIVSERADVHMGWSRMFEERGLPAPAAVLQTSSAQLIRQCLLDGDFVSICDLATCADALETGRLVRVEWAADRYRRPAGVFRRSETRLSRGARGFVDILRKICAESA